MNTNTNTQNKKPLTAAQTAALIGALAPVKVSKAGKAGKADKKGGLGSIATELGRMITKPANKPEKPTNEVREQVLGGLGVHGNPIKQIAKRCNGMTSASVIWSAIDSYRADNNGLMPTATAIDALRLSCIKRGELFESRVKLANIKCELWAYACYYQLGGKTNKSGLKKGN